MKYYIIAGEASGDIYGASLMAALKQSDPTAVFRFWGGAMMKNVDNNQAMDYKQTAFMGFWEVVKNLGTIRKLFKFCKKDILAFKPDRIIFIDYPGFNLRMADWAHQRGYHTSYFVAPQIWAWKKNRYKQIKKNIDELFVILPFEKGFYKGLGVEAQYYGHPLESMIETKQQNQVLSTPLRIGILPGSREQELQKHLPIFKQLIENRPQDQFTIALAPGVEIERIHQLLGKEFSNLTVSDKTKKVIREADVAIVKSGTSTLETALIGTPQIVIYKTSSLSYAIGKRLVKLPFISLVNIIRGKKIVTELIQDDFKLSNLNFEIEKLLKDENAKQMQLGYVELRESLKGEDIFGKIARRIIA